jgi:diguanylate cyclase (GGDEF)-like protein
VAMLRLVSCIALDHSWPHSIIAMTICAVGSLLTVRLLSKARKARKVQRLTWIFLSGFVGGATIWATHFMAMLGYKSGVLSGYDPKMTSISMLAVVATTIAGFAISTIRSGGLLAEAGGIVTGLGIALMHYVGVSGYEVAAERRFDNRYVLASLLCAAAFGVMSTRTALRPRSSRAKYVGAFGLFAAIASTHFLGMASLTLYPDPSLEISKHVLSIEAMTAIVAVVMAVIMALGASTYIIDLQSSSEAAERFRLLALRDALTHLPNRFALEEHLDQAIKNGAQTADVALLSIDLDRFREVNDVHGHAAGDAVLKTISRRLKRCLPEGVFVARVGGDEFIAVLLGSSDDKDVLDLSNRIVARLRQPVHWNEQTLLVGASIGVSRGRVASDNWDDLIGQADVAMGRAKASASDSVEFYVASMDVLTRERNQLNSDMPRALVNGEFELFYQLQNDTVTREVVALEVLLRWNHPYRGYISPATFIPIAEKSGFIVELGEWVVRTACTEASKWIRPLRIAVNVSPRQLEDGRLPGIVRETLVQTGLSASRMEIEITETGLIANYRNAIDTIKALKAIGVTVTMDDYGTGYSSLSTLQNFPFDKIKIDKSFVADVANCRLCAAIVRSTLLLASGLNIPVLAEGVESEEALDFLRKEGCPQVQGFLFGRPRPRSEIEAVVSKPLSLS